MKLDTLENIELKDIHEAFLDAFSDYEIKIDMPVEKLEEMMLTRSYAGKYSVGYFDEGRLRGFILTGFREISGMNYCYDVATGVTKEYQNKGIGSILLKELKQLLRKNGMDFFILEVLENNINAQKLYTQNGFEIVRKFNCFEKAIDRSSTNTDGYCVSSDYSLLKDIDDEVFLSYRPSWQNALISYENCRDRYNLTVISRDSGVMGYGIIHKENGSILQLGIRRSLDNQNFEELVFQLLANSTTAGQFRLLNVEDGSYQSRVLKDLGFNNYVNQFEMSCSLAIPDPF